MSKPRRPRFDEDPAGTYWFDDAEHLQQLYAYCRQDVETERALYRRLVPLPAAEHALWVFDQIVNARGIYADGVLPERATAIITAEQAALQAEVQALTAGVIESTNQGDKLIAWLATQGCEVTDLQRATVSAALRRKALTPDIRRVLEVRREATHASVNKFAGMLNWRGPDGRIRGALRYHGAATGRWASHGVQVHNFKRETTDTERKFAAAMSGDIEQARALGAPIEVCGDITRAVIGAPPGSRLLVGDFSGIESRVAAWIAGEPGKLAQWQQFDRSQDKADHPYSSIAAVLGFTGADAYDKGKRADLAFGFQGGIGAFRNYAGPDDTTSDEQIKAYRDAWRGKHPRIVAFWYGLDRTAVAAVRQTPQIIPYGKLSLQCRDLHGTAFLFIKLPSGHELAYPFPKLITNRFGQAAVEFMDNSISNGGWTPCNHGTGAYGGLWFENVVQATARDLLAAAMQRLDAAGYPVVLHVHDEIVCELSDGVGNVEEFKHLIEQLPAWADGLPIAAKVRNGPRWADVEQPIVHVPGSAVTQRPAARKAKRKVSVGSAEPLPLDADMVARVVAWAIEREEIRGRKEAGQPWPWTDDPILRAGRFCNVYREYDYGSICVRVKLVEPFANQPDLWFAVTMARCINEPAAWHELGTLVPFDAKHVRARLDARQARGDKVYRTDAYKPPLPGREHKNMSITEHLVDYVLGPLWRDRESLRPSASETLAGYSDRLRNRYKIGPFLAGQIIADLKHAQLKDAADWWDFALPGPGSERGLNRVCKRAITASWSEAQWLATLLRLRGMTAPAVAAAGIAPLDAQNMQNVLCEFDKYERARDKGGLPARKYKAATPATKPKADKERKRKAAAPVNGEMRATEASDIAQIVAMVAPGAANVATVAPEADTSSSNVTTVAPDTAQIVATVAPETTVATMAVSEAPDTACIALSVVPALQPPCLAAALAYADKGWCIFPAPRGAKKSHKSGAKHGGARWGATNDPDEIARDFARWPQANIGLPTGAENGFWVLEIDTKEGHDVDGVASLAALTAQHGALPPTRQAVSPSGSQHFYFRWPAAGSVRNSASEIGPGIDVRGEGGMVIAPPSIKPDVGAYRWVCEAEIAEAPDWLLALAAAPGSTDDTDAHVPGEPQAPLPLIKAALDAIPIAGMPYQRWIDVGHAVHAASGGSDEGFALFDAWTQASSEYDAEGIIDKWRSFHPHSIGYGSLEFWADEADPGWQDRYDAKLEAELWQADNGGAEQPNVGGKTGAGNGETSAVGADQTNVGGEFGETDAGVLLDGPLPAPRQWLTAGQFCRTFLSGLVAPGDVGKTTLRLTQAIELATGRELLGMHVYRRSRVLIVSFEDDLAELHRRLLAICKQHGINAAELRGWLFCRALNGGPKLAELDARGRRRQTGLLDGLLRRAIAQRHYDLLILDPFVKLHALNESDNPDMDFVCALLIKIAQDCNIAVDSPAHTHKGAIVAGDADARRGASAQRDAGRLDYTFTVMSEGEATQFGTPLEARKRYMRLDKAKANIVQAVKARWFQLVSVPLGNTTEEYPEGDNVQAIERWEPPETWGGTTPETLNAILDAIASGLPDGRLYSSHGAAKDRAAWLVVQRHCPDKPEAQCREMIKQWIKAEVLFVDEYFNPIRREKEPGLYVDANKRPVY
jgi:hypothetical protein